MNYDDLVKLSERATGGQWAPWKAPDGIWHARTEYRDSLGLRCTAWPAVVNCGGQDDESNAALIAASVNLIRSLCDPKVQEAMARAWFRDDEGWDNGGENWKREMCISMHAAIKALITGVENV